MKTQQHHVLSEASCRCFFIVSELILLNLKMRQNRCTKSNGPPNGLRLTRRLSISIHGDADALLAHAIPRRGSRFAVIAHARRLKSPTHTWLRGRNEWTCYAPSAWNSYVHEQLEVRLQSVIGRLVQVVPINMGCLRAR